MHATTKSKRWFFFERTLGALPDPRRQQGIRYPLRTVVTTALMAMVCGCDDAEALQSWGEANADWPAAFLDIGSDASASAKSAGSAIRLAGRAGCAQLS